MMMMMVIMAIVMDNDDDEDDVLPAVEPFDLSWPAGRLVRGPPFHWEGCEGPPACPDEEDEDEEDVDDDWEKLGGPPVGQGEGQQQQVVRLPVGPADLNQ